MMNRILLFAMILLLPLSFSWAGPDISSASASSELQLEKSASLKEKVQELNARQQKRLEKKINFVKDKMAKQQLKQKNTRQEAGPVRVALAIILVGVLVAILGFAGLGGILVNIGIVVLVVGLFVWLIGLLLG